MNSTHPDIVSNLASIKKWVAYYEYTWVGQRQEDGSRGRGLFPLVQWSQNEAALQLWPRTNNSSEGSNLFFILKTLLVLGLTPYIQLYNSFPPFLTHPKGSAQMQTHRNLTVLGICWHTINHIRPKIDRLYLIEFFLTFKLLWYSLHVTRCYVSKFVLYYLGFNSTWNEGLPKNASLHTVQKYFVDKV